MCCTVLCCVAGTAPVPAGQNQRHTKNSTELGKRQIVLVPLGTNTGPKKEKKERIKWRTTKQPTQQQRQRVAWVNMAKQEEREPGTQGHRDTTGDTRAPAAGKMGAMSDRDGVSGQANAAWGR